MKKEITTTGKNGEFKGLVLITFDYKREIVKGHNASTHDDTETLVPYHKIETYVNGKLWKDILLIKEREKVLEKVEGMEGQLINHLRFLADKENEITIESKLKEKGYN